MLAGLWRGGDHGDDTQDTYRTDQCHDITVFPERSLAAGACSGNGIVFDISDPLKPQRIDAVVDPGFAYWHSATFNNDGTKVIFTDEWGGGMRPRVVIRMTVLPMAQHAVSSQSSPGFRLSQDFRLGQAHPESRHRRRPAFPRLRDTL